MDLDTNLSILGDTLTLTVKQRAKPRIKFNAQTSSLTCYGVESMSIQAGQKVKISIAPVDSFGNVARVDGVPVWNLIDNGLGSLDVGPDGLASIFTSNGKVGSVTVEVAADVDLSEGIRNLGGSVAIDIVAGEAVDLGVHAEPIVIEAAPIAPEQAAAIADAGAASPVVNTVDVLPEAPVAPAADTTAPAADTTAPAADVTAAPAADVVGGDQAPVSPSVDTTAAPVDTTTTTDQPAV